jgi:hypothetical protein
MSDTPSELKVVVDRSMEVISISNNLPSTFNVFTYDVLSSMDDETPILDMMVPQMEKMYMVYEDDVTPWIHHDEDVDHMEATTTTTTPTSHERDYKGNNMGVDDDVIVVSYDTFTFHVTI